MLPDELKLIAHHQAIRIKVTTDVAEIFLLEKNIGPFKIGELHEVPIHCALKMAKFNLCEIQTPLYLKEEHLRELKKKELETNEYQEIYPYIFELYEDILQHLKGDVEHLRLLVSEIREIRLKKTKTGLKSIDGKALCLNNLTVYEYEQIKPILLKGMEMAARMEKREDLDEKL